jgi:hypothetical protein
MKVDCLLSKAEESAALSPDALLNVDSLHRYLTLYIELTLAT